MESSLPSQGLLNIKVISPDGAERELDTIFADDTIYEVKHKVAAATDTDAANIEILIDGQKPARYSDILLNYFGRAGKVSVIEVRAATMVATEMPRAATSAQQTILRELFEVGAIAPPRARGKVITITFEIRRKVATPFPLHVLFDSFKTNQKIPFIKFLPASKQEPFYKLWAPARNKQNQKIPFLTRGKINYLIQHVRIPKQSYIGFYSPKTPDVPEFIVLFNSAGSAFVEVNADGEDLTLSEIEQPILSAVQHIFQEVGEAMKATGLAFPTDVNSFLDTEIYNISYKWTMDVESASAKEYSSKYFRGIQSMIFSEARFSDRKVQKGQSLFVYKRAENFAAAEIVNFSRSTTAEWFYNLGTLTVTILNIPSLWYLPTMQSYMNYFAAVLSGYHKIPANVKRFAEGEKMNSVNVALVAEPDDEAADADADAAVGDDSVADADDISIGSFGAAEEDEGIAIESFSDDEESIDLMQGLDNFDEDDEDDVAAARGGAPKMKASRDVYTLLRLKKAEPEIFNKDEKGEGFTYSRSCPAFRQPIILTPEELSQQNPKTYTQALKYRKYHYICPRYWCVKQNRAMTDEEVKRGDCDGVTAADQIQLIEYNDEKQHNTKGKYSLQYPSFVNSAKAAQQRFKYPCCFKTPPKAEDIEGAADDAEEDATAVAAAPPRPPVKKGHHGFYVLKYENTVSHGSWGFLSPELQKILGTDYSTAISPADPTTIVAGSSCYLRYGVEYNSFLGAMSDLYYEGENKNTDDFRATIIESIKIEDFMAAQSGTVVRTFYDSAKMSATDKKRRAKRYADRIPPFLSADPITRDIVLCSLEAFEHYVARTPPRELDETYLWDLISGPNTDLFDNGIHIVMLEVPPDGGRIQVVCPSNPFSAGDYKEERPVVLVLKNRNKTDLRVYYEMIYFYENRGRGKSAIVQRSFSAQNSPVIRSLLKRVATKCAPQRDPDSTRRYDFEAPQPVMDVAAALLATKHYSILYRVLNHFGNIVGLWVSAGEARRHGFVPVSPFHTTPTNLKKFRAKLATDIEWNSAAETVTFLDSVAQRAPTIKCKPEHFVVENDTIIGILTETQQFVKTVAESATRIAQINKQTGIKLDAAEDIDDSEVEKDFAQLPPAEGEPARLAAAETAELRAMFYSIFQAYVKVAIRRAGIAANLAAAESRDEIREAVVRAAPAKFVHIGARARAEFAAAAASCIMATDSDGAATCEMAFPKNDFLDPTIDNEQFYYDRVSDEIWRNPRMKYFYFNDGVFTLRDEIGDTSRDEIVISGTLLPNLIEKIYDSASTNKMITFTKAAAAPRVAAVEA